MAMLNLTSKNCTLNVICYFILFGILGILGILMVAMILLTLFPLIKLIHKNKNYFLGFF